MKPHMPFKGTAKIEEAEDSLSEALFLRYADLLYRKTGILLKDYKKYLVVNRLSRLVGLGLAFETFQELYRALLEDPDGELMADFVNALTTNYSCFFRDPVHFRFLERYLRDQAGKQEYLRIWSAASSSGEEAYSIAITLHAHRSLLPADTRILATDISTRVLKQAEKGVFSSAHVREHVDPKLVSRYFSFHPEQGAYEVVPEIRELVSFRYLNLLSEYPFQKKMDVVFLRNVLIYFGAEEKREVVARAYECLKPGGSLVVGLSESLLGVDTPLKMRKNSVYEKDEADR
jgi:chemotaxis protein methyltransferase CheR